MDAIKLSLIIPCYNEAQSLPRLIGRLKECFTRADVEVVLVDNGSKDASQQILAEQLACSTNIRSVRVEVNQGYGYGILQGLKAAHGTYIGWTHADLQTDPKDACALLRSSKVMMRAFNFLLRAPGMVAHYSIGFSL